MGGRPCLSPPPRRAVSGRRPSWFTGEGAVKRSTSCRSLRDSQGQLRPQARASVPVQAKQVAAASPHAPPRAKGQAVQSCLRQAETGMSVGLRPGLLGPAFHGAVSISGNGFAGRGSLPGLSPPGAPGSLQELVKVTVAKRVQAGNLSFLENWGSAGRSGVVRASTGAPAGPGLALALTMIPGRTGTCISISLFIRGVNNPCIVFRLLDYFVFV